MKNDYYRKKGDNISTCPNCGGKMDRFLQREYTINWGCKNCNATFRYREFKYITLAIPYDEAFGVK